LADQLVSGMQVETRLDAHQQMNSPQQPVGYPWDVTPAQKVQQAPLRGVGSPPAASRNPSGAAANLAKKDLPFCPNPSVFGRLLDSLSHPWHGKSSGELGSVMI
jgi:hypothetical protein